MDVSVIIVNYNTKELTLNCINSIIEHTSGVEYEIILVDNASSDGSQECFSRDERVIFVASDVNLGFGKANNLGYEHSSGRYIFCLNSDTIIENNAIKIFFDKAESANFKFGCLGTYLLDANHNKAQSYGGKKHITAFGELYKALFGTFVISKDVEDVDVSKDFAEVRTVIGADMFIPRTVIEECGLFDPRYFMYQEEGDMQRTFKLRGYKSYIVKGPQIVHLEGRSNVAKMSRLLMQMEGAFIYVKKWEPRCSYYIYRILFPLIRIPIMLIHRHYSFSDKKKYIKKLFISIP